MQNEILRKITNFYNKIVRTIKSSILCIRFPFLYPRNRFTGNHYDFWPIRNFHRKWYKHCVDSFILHFVKEMPEKTEYIGHFDGGDYRIDVDNDNIYIVDIYSKIKTVYSGKLSNFGTGKFANKTGWNNGAAYIKVDSDWKDKHDSCRFVTYIHSKWLYNLIMFFDWINDHVLQIFHCIPTYTELNAMPLGWRNKFGIEICKDIKKSLLNSGGRKALRRYRITQIKEKFGGLRWYDINANDEIFKTIIPKYEDLSYKTCIDCGKPSEYFSVGWISPYCSNCVDKDRKYIKITEEDAFNKALYPWEYKEET